MERLDFLLQSRAMVTSNHWFSSLGIALHLQPVSIYILHLNLRQNLDLRNLLDDPFTMCPESLFLELSLYLRNGLSNFQLEGGF